MVLLWFVLMAALFLNGFVAHENGQMKNTRNPQLKQISADGNTQNQDNVSNDEIWFDTSDTEKKDYENNQVDNYGNMQIKQISEVGNTETQDKDIKDEIWFSPKDTEMKDYENDQVDKQSILQLKEISADEDAEILYKVSDDKIWFNTLKAEKKDYETLDVVDDSTSYPREEVNHESLLNDVKQEATTILTKSYDTFRRFKRDIENANVDESFENDRQDLPLPISDTLDSEYLNKYSPKPYTKVYDHDHAGPEKEKGEDRWDISPCVTNLRELYTCIFCSSESSVRQQFISCYELLPKRVKEQSMKCFSEVLKIPFGVGSDDMDYYHYLCQKHKSIKQIIKCTASKLPELPKEKFLEEERTLSLYSYCLYSINSRHCC